MYVELVYMYIYYIDMNDFKSLKFLKIWQNLFN